MFMQCSDIPVVIFEVILPIEASQLLQFNLQIPLRLKIFALVESLIRNFSEEA